MSTYLRYHKENLNENNATKILTEVLSVLSSLSWPCPPENNLTTCAAAGAVMTSSASLTLEFICLNGNSRSINGGLKIVLTAAQAVPT